MNPHKYAFKNYIFDFYGTLVDIETDEESPVLWDTNPMGLIILGKA